MEDTENPGAEQGSAPESAHERAKVYAWRPRSAPPARQGAPLPHRGALRVVGLRVDGLTIAAVVTLDELRLSDWRGSALHEGEEAKPGRGVVEVPLTGWGGELESVQLAVNVQRGDRFSFKNGDCHGLADEHPLSGCALEVSFSAVFLATNGVETAIAYARAIASTLGEVRELRTRRLDLAADIAGWDFLDRDRDSWVKPGRASLSGWGEMPETDSDRVVREHVGTKITGYAVAPGGPIMLRLYDKREQLSKKAPDKTEGEEAIWRSHGWEGEGSVVRCEFQLRSEALRSFGVVDPNRIEDSLDALWTYLVTRWCRLVLPGTATRRSNCYLDPRWELVQSIRFRHESYPAARRYFRGGVQVTHAVGCNLSMLANSQAAPEVRAALEDVPATEPEAEAALGRVLGELGALGARQSLISLVAAHQSARAALEWLGERVAFAMARASTVGGGAEPPATRRGRPAVQLWRRAA